MWHWFIPNDVGGVAAIMDFFVAVVGFGFALFGISKARAAVRDLRNRIRGFETAVDFSAAMTALEEIKRLHRAEVWPVLPDRYASIRKVLAELRTSGFDLDNEQSTIVQRALTTLVDLEKQVEKALSTPGSSLRPDRLNSRVSQDVDGLINVFNQLKAQVTGGRT